MTNKLEDTSLRLKDEMDLYRKMMDKLKQNRQQFQTEKEAMQEVGEGGILYSHMQKIRGGVHFVHSWWHFIVFYIVYFSS